MKSTGVIRRIDELGRIVIPKEIRRNLGIRDGESLEIYVHDNSIELTKISKVLELSDLANRLCENTKETMNLSVLITDRDKVMTTSFYDEISMFDQKLSEELLHYIKNREIYISKNREIKKYFNQELEGFFLIQPIITSIDCIGLIMFYKKELYTTEEISFSKFLANILINKIDI